MIARTFSAQHIKLRRFVAFSLLPAMSLAGCAGLRGQSGRHVEQPGVVDCNQPRELRMVSLPAYVIEAPDELEISIRPANPDLAISTVQVQADGTVDLGFAGDVYLEGLTLEEAERKISQHLQVVEGSKAEKEPYRVSVRLSNGIQSKSYYVLGTVTTQGKFPITGNETVLDGILAAGLRSNSLPDKAYLVRPRPAGMPDVVLKVDWAGIKDRGDTLTNYQLFPGDRIVVPGGKPPGLLSTLFGG